MTKTNKINFYLIKDGYELSDIFKEDPDALHKKQVKEGYDLYYNPKITKPAPWVQDFFNTEIKEQRADGKEYHVFYSASSQAVLIRKVTVGGTEFTCAICFGNGFHMLDKDAIEPRFGLLTVLNVVDEGCLRRVDKHDISGTPKFTAEQLSRQGSQMDFGLDVELDILLGVTGSLRKTVAREKRLKDYFGSTISGKSNLSVNAKFDVDNIDKLLRRAIIASGSKRYEQKGFDWIDKIDLVKKKTQKFDDLNTALSEKLADENNRDGFWLAVPELVNWQNIVGFYFNNDEDNLFEDITFDAFLQVVEAPITFEKLKSTTVRAMHPSKGYATYDWNAFNCLYAEIELDGESFVLINGEWYKLKPEFLEATNNRYAEILQNHAADLDFRNYVADDENENGYNSNLTNDIQGAVCMDAKNISHGGRYSKIEFCDVFDRENNKLIHVKKYSGSSVLSHLFAQGFVSSELLANDAEFREKVETKVSEIANEDFSFPDNIEGYEVVFGIISKPGKTDIPFFSKVNLNNTFKRIQNMRGFSASIAFIENHAPLEVQQDG